MSSGLIISLEMTLVLGGALGLAAWELLRLRRERAKPRRPLPSSPDGRTRNGKTLSGVSISGGLGQVNGWRR